jgi:hypothetical protein
MKDFPRTAGSQTSEDLAAILRVRWGARASLCVSFEDFQIAVLGGGGDFNALRMLLRTFNYVNTFDRCKLVRYAADKAETAIHTSALDQRSVPTQPSFEADAHAEWNHTRVWLVFSHKSHLTFPTCCLKVHGE